MYLDRLLLLYPNFCLPYSAHLHNVAPVQCCKIIGAIQAASPREGTDAHGADLEVQAMSSNRGRSAEAAADSEAPVPQPKANKRVRWVDEALNEPIAVCQVSKNCSKACLWDHLLLVTLGEYKLHDDLPALSVAHTLLVPRSTFWLWA